MRRPYRPLDNIRVLEIGAFYAGPFCCQILGDFGAEVIKVESPGEGDPLRRGDPNRYKDRSLWWPILARNKKSVTLDLRSPEGQEIAQQLARRSDVLVENFRRGVLEKLGLGYETLRELNPGLVLVRISGYGQTGPYRDKAGFGKIGEAVGGIHSVTGYPGLPPVRCGISIGDALTGIFATIGALTALHQRQRSSIGQVVDIGLYEGVLAVMEDIIPNYQFLGRIRERSGNVRPRLALSNIYPTRDGSWIAISANADTVFERLCAAMGKPDMAKNPNYAKSTARGERQAELDDLVTAWTAGYNIDELQTLLDEHGVPAGGIYTAREMLADPHFIARQDIIEVPDPVLGLVKMQNVFPYLSETPGGVEWAGPELGQHTNEILEGLLGLSSERLAELRKRGII